MLSLILFLMLYSDSKSSIFGVKQDPSYNLKFILHTNIQFIIIPEIEMNFDYVLCMQNAALTPCTSNCD